MALDSKEKRAAVLGVARPWMRDKLPTSDKDEAWRVASGNAYSGNALTSQINVPGVEFQVKDGRLCFKLGTRIFPSVEFQVNDGLRFKLGGRLLFTGETERLHYTAKEG